MKSITVLFTSCCSLSLLLVEGRSIGSIGGRTIHAKVSKGQHFKSQSELADIILSEEQEQALKEANSNGKRAVNSGILVKTWPNGVIPYVMDPRITGTRYQKSFYKAMDMWEKYTCIKFMKRTDEATYVTFTNGSTCNSGVGVWNKRSYEVYLGKKCRTAGNAMHELGHVIGFWHEHQRPDRDEYIEINYENLQDNFAARNSYSKLPSLFVNSYGVKYDYASIMHYAKDSFAKNRRDAFRVKKDLPKCLTDVGQRISISRKDIEQANKLYKCPERPIPTLCKLLSRRNARNETLQQKLFSVHA